MRIVIDLQGAQSASRFRGIGRYSLALALGVARNAGEHEVWIILNAALPAAAAAIRAEFEGLVPQERIRVFDIVTPSAEHDVGNQWRTRVNEQIREYCIAQLRPDAVLVTSLFEGFVDDAVGSVGSFIAGADTAVVLYDLIPFLNPQAYLPALLQQDYYARKIASLREAGLLLSISDYSRQEALDALGMAPERIVAISTAVDERFCPGEVAPETLAALRARFGITRKFIMYAPGGFDARKNIDGLVAAYATLAPALRASHQLLIASKLEARERERLQQHGARCGLAADELLLTDYVDDDTLVALYRSTELFVFPSRHEGFGLPALEAMACGAIVIGGDNSSIPEVIGCAEAMFDATSPAAISERINAVLSDPQLQQRLRTHGAQQARKFSWDATAQRALRALEAHHAARPLTTARSKRRLAFVSPLPPERTGIADYAAQCLPALMDYFDIELVIHQDSLQLPPELDQLPRRSADWFTEHGAEFDQVIYQFGNSPYHSHMFALLERHPGVVVLHDFFLSSVLAYEQMTGAMPGAFTGALFASHGFAALRTALAPDGQETAKQDYPCNLEVLQGANAVIVHSTHALELAQRWYGPQAGRDWHVVPLPRSLPENGQREAARAALGIAPDALLVCSFGFVDSTKQSHRLLAAWLASGLHTDPRCELVFVGANHGGAYGVELLAAIAASASPRIRIAGWSDAPTYQRYLQAADIGVQLRSVSRGETSAAVLDCMNYGLATIVNANGSMAALDDDAVWKLDDHFADADLTAALDTLHRDVPRRAQLGQRAAAAIERTHRPSHAARLYADVLDADWARRNSTMPALVQALAAAPELRKDSQARVQLAHCLSLAPHRWPQVRQLLVDVSNIVRNDLGTGIERVVRAQLLELLQLPPHGLRVEAVFLSQEGGNWHYRYARSYACKVLGMQAHAGPDEAIDLNPGDIFYAPDYAPSATIAAAQAGLYADWRARGMSVNILIHDLLPVLRPEFFPPFADRGHAAWLACIAANADRLVCISGAVADEMRSWMAAQNVAHRPALAVVHHGADIGVHAAPDAVLAPQFAALAAVPSFLMVGTIEPRKGHLQALDAFEALWRDGAPFNLVIVGNVGWKPLPDAERRTIPRIVARLQQHPELGKRLHWLRGLDDAALQQVYQASACLLAPSEGEGFGLPLIEAASYSLPILARDIPVFREVAGASAHYFSGDDAATLAAAVHEWVALHERGAHPSPDTMQWHTWRDNAVQLLAILDGRTA